MKLCPHGVGCCSIMFDRCSFCWRWCKRRSRPVLPTCCQRVVAYSGMRTIAIASNGHFTAHWAQPVQPAMSCSCEYFFQFFAPSDITCGGHAATHQPQPVQRSVSMAGSALRSVAMAYCGAACMAHCERNFGPKKNRHPGRFSNLQRELSVTAAPAPVATAVTASARFFRARDVHHNGASTH